MQKVLTFCEPHDTPAFGFDWRPWYSAKMALRESLSGLGDWLNWVIAVLIKLPLMLAWVATVGGILWILWKIGRAVRLRYLNSRMAEPEQEPDATEEEKS